LSPLSRLVSRTRAPATGAPAGSVTTPAIVPVGACAGVSKAHKSHNAKTETILTALLAIISFQPQERSLAFNSKRTERAFAGSAGVSPAMSASGTKCSEARTNDSSAFTFVETPQRSAGSAGVSPAMSASGTKCQRSANKRSISLYLRRNPAALCWERRRLACNERERNEVERRANKRLVKFNLALCALNSSYLTAVRTHYAALRSRSQARRLRSQQTSHLATATVIFFFA
jgi:hypothetical protein